MNNLIIKLKNCKKKLINIKSKMRINNKMNKIQKVIFKKLMIKRKLIIYKINNFKLQS